MRDPLAADVTGLRDGTWTATRRRTRGTSAIAVRGLARHATWRNGCEAHEGGGLQRPSLRWERACERTAGFARLAKGGRILDLCCVAERANPSPWASPSKKRPSGCVRSCDEPTNGRRQSRAARFHTRRLTPEVGCRTDERSVRLLTGRGANGVAARTA